ncbi:hypothetical protein BKA62DRAFT_149431 [Auriculariales sp. MPI-PUGE-AT-0066]|nr:hypothetical protein BKA62DRAFT_149431 [Auriculariales sp. MPI-PUGE-AT-0066]
MPDAVIPPEVSFSADVRRLAFWADRAGLQLPGSAEALGVPYARAHRWFLESKRALVQLGWRETSAATSDSRLLFSVEFPGPRTSAGVPRSPPVTLSLPKHPSSFFSPERTLQWQMCFHSTAFSTLRYSIPALNDILFLLQCLVPGMLIGKHVEEFPQEGQIYITSRSLPNHDWVSANEARLIDIFGQQYYRQLWKAVTNTQMCFLLEKERK